MSARIGRAGRIDAERERWRVANGRIAALEAENARLTAEMGERQDTATLLASMLYDEQLRRMLQPEGAHVREMLRRLDAEEISNGKAAEIILDFVAGASFAAYLAAWDAEWRAQVAGSRLRRLDEVTKDLELECFGILDRKAFEWHLGECDEARRDADAFLAAHGGGK